MDIDKMRWIDRHIGVPLCFGLTFIQKIYSWINSPRSTPAFQKPKKLLFIELSEMGSAILADPAITLAQNLGAETFFVIFKKNAASLKILNTVKESHIFTIDPNGLYNLAKTSIQFLMWCRKNKIDTVIDLELFSRFTALLTGLSGAKKKIGFYKFHNEGLYRGELLTHKVAYNPHLHISKSFIALVKSAFSHSNEELYLKEPITDEQIVLKKSIISEASTSRAIETLKKLNIDINQHKIVLFNCAGGEFLIERRWPKAHYSELAKMIINSNSDIRILLTGAPDEKNELQKIVELINHQNAINFAGLIRFEDLTALYSLSTLMVSNDSGPAHFASTTSLPIFVFFGPETPALYGALGNFTPLYASLACSPCVTAWNHRKTPCINNICVQVITPNQVYKKLESLVNAKI